MTFVVATLLCTTMAWGQHNVLTQRGDARRDGQFSTETYLTPSNVNSNQFGSLFSYAVDGYVVAQPLYVSGVSIPGVGVVNVVYVATTNDSVFAFDADTPGTGVPLWQVSLIDATGTTEPVSLLGCATGNGYTEVGIIGTPVIDLSTNTMYVVAKTIENGTSYVFTLHALDITTGAEKLGGPVPISASFGDVTLETYSQYDLQRPALLESNGVIYIGFGSNGCDQNAHGWLLAYSASTLQQLAVFNSSPGVTWGSSIWMSGVGPSADSNGNVYVATANGTFDVNTGGLDYGDTALKLSLDGAAFSVLDYFTPSNQAKMRSGDLDLGSGGVVLLPDDEFTQSATLAVAEGKTGTIYLINTSDMGKYDTKDGGDGNEEDVIGATGQMYGAPIYWNGYLYTAARQDHIKAFSMANGMLSSTWVFESATTYTLNGVPTLSANGNEEGTGIFWLVRNTNNTGDVFELSAFNAINNNSFANLAELYNTQDVSGRDALGPTAHFATPLVANGRVYVGTQTQLKAYGFFPELNPSSGNNQSATVNTPITLSVQATDPYSGAGIPGVSVTFGSGNKGTFGANPVTTDSTGTATTTYTLPETTGTYALTATSSGYSSASMSEIAVAGPASAVSVISGSSQSGTVGTVLPLPLVVEAKDSFGNKVSGASVTFSDSYGGTFSPNPASTGSNGEASTTFTLPTSAHTGFAVTASSGTATAATLHESSVAAAPATEAISSGNKQTAAPGTQLPKPLVVLVKDQYGNAVSGVTVTFSDGGAGGSFLDSTPLTNSAGKASATYTLPPAAGTYPITATVNSNVNVVSFTEVAN
ncbi:MAG: Ig-like domain-containing protein [Candidatus Sulfotelmatobacter sp.]